MKLKYIGSTETLVRVNGGKKLAIAPKEIFEAEDKYGKVLTEGPYKSVFVVTDEETKKETSAEKKAREKAEKEKAEQEEAEAKAKAEEEARLLEEEKAKLDEVKDEEETERDNESEKDEKLPEGHAQLDENGNPL